MTIVFLKESSVIASHSAILRCRGVPKPCDSKLAVPRLRFESPSGGDPGSGEDDSDDGGLDDRHAPRRPLLPRRTLVDRAVPRGPSKASTAAAMAVAGRRSPQPSTTVDLAAAGASALLASTWPGAQRATAHGARETCNPPSDQLTCAIPSEDGSASLPWAQSFVFSFGHVVGLIIVTIWSIAYPSWPTFPLIAASCILWHRRTTLFRPAAPLIFVYCFLLILLEFIGAVPCVQPEVSGTGDSRYTDKPATVLALGRFAFTACSIPP